MPARTLIAFTILSLVSLGSASGLAQVVVKHILTLDNARKVIDAAKAEAERVGAPCVVAVVDDGGWLIAQERMDTAPMLVSVELAPRKARSAAIFRKPTADLEKAINGGRVAELSVPGEVQMQGGVPIMVGGAVVGAVGISADTPAHDGQIAEVAARALTVR